MQTVSLDRIRVTLRRYNLRAGEERVMQTAILAASADAAK